VLFSAIRLLRRGKPGTGSTRTGQRASQTADQRGALRRPLDVDRVQVDATPA
jgi:hypothetical protein